MTSLRQRMTEDMQVRNLALNTQTSYVQQVSLLARNFHKSPEQLGPEEIRTYQVYLTNEGRLSPRSVLIAVAALRFLYKVSLKKDWSFEDMIPAPKKPQRLPLVLSPEEVVHFLTCVASIKYRAILTTCFAAGLRISEAIHLKPCGGLVQPIFSSPARRSRFPSPRSVSRRAAELKRLCIMKGSAKGSFGVMMQYGAGTFAKFLPWCPKAASRPRFLPCGRRDGIECAKCVDRTAWLPKAPLLWPHLDDLIAHDFSALHDKFDPL